MWLLCDARHYGQAQAETRPCRSTGVHRCKCGDRFTTQERSLVYKVQIKLANESGFQLTPCRCQQCPRRVWFRQFCRAQKNIRCPFPFALVRRVPDALRLAGSRTQNRRPLKRGGPTDLAARRLVQHSGQFPVVIALHTPGQRPPLPPVRSFNSVHVAGGMASRSWGSHAATGSPGPTTERFSPVLQILQLLNSCKGNLSARASAVTVSSDGTGPPTLKATNVLTSQRWYVKPGVEDLREASTVWGGLHGSGDAIPRGRARS